MTSQWSGLPLLPLRCILDHLSTEDALAAMSTCRHWRNAILLYEGHKETLKLRAKHLEKSMFVSRIFRRHTRKLHIYLDCSEADFEKFMNFVLPQFFDTAKLQELIFIGPTYVNPHQILPFVKLKRIITEALVFKHMHSIQKLALLGCAVSTVKNENDRHTHKHTEYYSRLLKFDKVYTAADTLLSSGNATLMAFSTLKHIILDYEQVNTASLQTLSHLGNLTHLTLNISYKRHTEYHTVDWYSLKHYYSTPLHVGVNIISVPSRKFPDIMENVLVEGLHLTSFKVLFCKYLCMPLISHVTQFYKSSLRELVWVDSPYDSTDAYRFLRPLRNTQPDDYAHVNPFVLLCWQCEHLSRLVIHGYWVWQYDVLGFARLGKNLSRLEVSAIYDKQDMFQNCQMYGEEGCIRVLVNDEPVNVDMHYIREINGYTKFKWKPVPWGKLPPGLRTRPTAQQRAAHVLAELRAPAV